jgi:predicted ATPase
MWGGTGCGKTFVMDLFFDTLPPEVRTLLQLCSCSTFSGLFVAGHLKHLWHYIARVLPYTLP